MVEDLAKASDASAESTYPFFYEVSDATTAYVLEHPPRPAGWWRRAEEVRLTVPTKVTSPWEETGVVGKKFLCNQQGDTKEILA